MNRVRRDKIVLIPEEWIGKLTTKLTKKLRKDKAKEKEYQRKKYLLADESWDFNNQCYGEDE